MRSMPRRPLIFAIFALALLGAGALMAAPAKGAGDRPEGPSVQPVTVEPVPPLSLSIRLAGLQKYTRGGVASIVVEADSAVDLESVTLAVHLPDKVSFADGTRVKNWDRRLEKGGRIEIPADLLVGGDGVYTVSAEATATFHGTPLHRGIAFTLSAGVPEAKLPIRNGAIEYPGVTGGEGN